MHVDPVMYEAFARETANILREDLRGWALEVMRSGLSYAARMAERDRCLRAAAEFLPDGLSMSERVRRLHSAMSTMARSTRPAHPDGSTLEGCIALALLARDRVPNVRQLRKVLEA
ncbi:hypothetical protein [Pyxidicoccus xibeiensis]|uniref:hypothetical protein n=1 Tax=Pyxidicoccus xibeiensis TaxID=2906759 RepID=UPI0020A82BE9|nr:hypothetical protein [Pyxidicoccus xibeiensis]MCP3137539.1 hypothetical protein [Pyxidicoccus xibeiensis]